MTDTVFPTGLRALAPNYDLILCDVWGVIHNGRSAFAEAGEALVKFREDGGRVVLITNAPVPKPRVIRYFAPLGVPDEAWDDCASSGDATRHLLESQPHKTIWVYGMDNGEEHDRFLYEGLPNPVAEGPEADLMLCIGLPDQQNDHPEDYREELREIARVGPVMVCANPDIQVRVGNQLVWCAGALAAIYEEEGGKVIYPGKPHAAIYDLARQKAAALGPLPDPARILTIGDGPITDIAGANREGLDCLYVGTGLANTHSEDFSADVRKLMDEAGVRATYAMRALNW
ncbi:MAG: TIGR01459 family HAD-type hydrolase [Hyphomonadaceae bacterium]|nr:TIGR01459 family HAD-type hydrolase [Hyphomonadaceae bacterium]